MIRGDAGAFSVFGIIHLIRSARRACVAWDRSAGKFARLAITTMVRRADATAASSGRTTAPARGTTSADSLPREAVQYARPDSTTMAARAAGILTFLARVPTRAASALPHPRAVRVCNTMRVCVTRCVRPDSTAWVRCAGEPARRASLITARPATAIRTFSRTIPWRRPEVDAAGSPGTMRSKTAFWSMYPTSPNRQDFDLLALIARVFSECVYWPETEATIQDESGRLWQVLFMAAVAVRAAARRGQGRRSNSSFTQCRDVARLQS